VADKKLGGIPHDRFKAFEVNLLHIDAINFPEFFCQYDCEGAIATPDIQEAISGEPAKAFKFSGDYIKGLMTAGAAWRPNK